MDNPILTTFHGNSSNIHVDNSFETKMDKAIYETIVKFPAYFFNNRTYSIDFYISKQLSEIYLELKNVLYFEVEDFQGRFLEYTGDWIGSIRPKFEWLQKKIDRN